MSETSKSFASGHKSSLAYVYCEVLAHPIDVTHPTTGGSFSREWPYRLGDVWVAQMQYVRTRKRALVPFYIGPRILIKSMGATTSLVDKIGRGALKHRRSSITKNSYSLIIPTFSPSTPGSHWNLLNCFALPPVLATRLLFAPLFSSLLN